MTDERTVSRAITEFGRLLKDRYLNNPDWVAQMYREPDDAIEELLQIACAEVGVERDVYERIVMANSELEAYQRDLVQEAVLADIQPGPDNPVVRESAGARRPVRHPRRWWQFWKSW